jgi:hypothetical protein
MRTLVAILATLAATAPCLAQRLPQPKPVAQLSMLLPVALDNPVFQDLTSVLGQLDGSFHLPLWKGVGVAAGVNASFHELNEDGLGDRSVPTMGHVNRWVWYGGLDYRRYLGAVAFYQLDLAFGQGTWQWACSSCAANQRQSAFHWGAGAGLYAHASANLAFGLRLGFDADQSMFGPGVIGLDRFPGRTDMGAAYRFVTVGLGFSTGFERAEEGRW